MVDLSACVRFYESLGLTHRVQSAPAGSPGPDRHSLHFGSQKLNIHIKGSELEPKATTVQVGSGDLCFVVDESVDEVLANLKKADVEVLEGEKVVDRTGALGTIRSVYVRDPDGNLVE